jgi:hypothetical protein
VTIIESQCIDHQEATDSFDLDSSCHLDTTPWNRYQEHTYHLAQVSIRAHSPECNSRRVPKHILVQLCMSRLGTVCTRRQHDICRPGKEWLQKLALKKSTVMQQTIMRASWYPLPS